MRKRYIVLYNFNNFILPENLQVQGGFSKCPKESKHKDHRFLDIEDVRTYTVRKYTVYYYSFGLCQFLGGRSAWWFIFLFRLSDELFANWSNRGHVQPLYTFRPQGEQFIVVLFRIQPGMEHTMCGWVQFTPPPFFDPPIVRQIICSIPGGWEVPGFFHAYHF